MKQSDFNPLLSISPIDGRYKYLTEELSEYSSEFAVIKYRTEIEIKYLIALSRNKIIRKFNATEIKSLEDLIKNFSINDAEKIKKIEETTKHDVKAIEYFLKEKYSKSSLNDVLEFIHFGLTTWDINNISERTMLRDAIDKVLLVKLKELITEISRQSKIYINLSMLGRTHGQAAIPTTLGKEIQIFQYRLQKEIKFLESSKLYGKLNGAIGNFNALSFAYPKTNWRKFSKNFLNDFKLEMNASTNQIAPYEDVITILQSIQRVNGILLDFNQDMWRYISDDWLIQENKKNEIGSSTMPQKINPIMFENSEGNLIIANSLIEGFTNKLPISRLQRDLSGSTIVRNFGLALAYSLLAYKNTLLGLKRIKANEEKINKDLNSDWSILSEAVQIYLKKNNIKNGYEILKDLTRGNKMDNITFQKMINELPLSEKQKSELRKITPENYTGIF